jgi:serine/threonine-protein kinase
MRLSVELGADASLVSNTLDEGQGALLSPDGTVLAFVAQPSPEALPRLYVRRLEDLQATPLSGTDGARNPFFSPDGRWIAFVTEGKLKKVAVTGGGAVTLSEGTGPALGTTGGNWAPDGSIVFAQDAGTSIPLMRVPAAGGTPELLLGEAAPGDSMRWPQVLPSGKAVVYTIATIDSPAPSIAVQRLSGGPRRIVVRDGYHGRYLPSGHLVYVREGALFAVAFDPDRLEVMGPPARAIAGVNSNSTAGGAHFACSDRGTLVYLPSPTAESTIQWIHRSGKRRPLRDVPRDYRSLRFSPDGLTLLLDIIDGSARDLWAYEWERDRLTRLTFDPAPESIPVWTPDGRRIVFSSTRADQKTRNLYWMRADGTGEPERLTESNNAQWAGSWHPGGRLLAYSEMTRQTVRPDIMILPIEGSEELGWKPGKPTAFVESPFVENSPSFSPDGRWLAYMSNETGRFEVYVRPFTGSGGRWQISMDGGRFPVWSRTRPELFFHSNDQKISVVPYSVVGGEFRAERPRAFNNERFTVPPNSFSMDLHPDGERFAVVISSQSPDAKLDKVVLIVDFFDYLRQIAPVER